MDNEDLERMIAGNFPLINAPHGEQIAPPEKFGMRYVVGDTGLFREVTTPWLYSIQQIAKVDGQPTPYGRCTPKVTLRCGNPPAELWKSFRVEAEKAMPNECAGAFVWNHTAKTWRFAMREASMANPGWVDYQEVECGEDEVIVVDIHSHGTYPAFFSSQDDKDDKGGIKVSAVIGQLDTDQPMIALRLVCLDRMMKMSQNGLAELHVHMEEAK